MVVGLISFVNGIDLRCLRPTRQPGGCRGHVNQELSVSQPNPVWSQNTSDQCGEESCPMQDDPERGECFQHKMILKRRQPGEGTLRVNANHHGACSTSHAGRDARIRGLQRQPQLYRRRAQGDLRSCRMHLAGARVLAASEEKQRRRAALFGQDQRAQLGADHAADPALPPKRGRPARGTPPASLSAPLHTGRYRPVGHAMRPTKGFRVRHCGASYGANTTSTARPPTDGPPSRPRTSTTCGAPRPIETPRPSHPDALPRGGHWRAAAAQPV